MRIAFMVDGTGAGVAETPCTRQVGSFGGRGRATGSQSSLCACLISKRQRGHCVGKGPGTHGNAIREAHRGAQRIEPVVDEGRVEEPTRM